MEKVIKLNQLLGQEIEKQRRPLRMEFTPAQAHYLSEPFVGKVGNSYMWFKSCK
jgi:hypothetical protein